MNILEILKKKDKSYFYIKNISELNHNPKFKSYFERLPKAQLINQNSVAISYLIGTEMEVIKRLQDMFDYFKVDLILSNQVEQEIKKYKIEIDQFEEFKRNADLIRNNKFKEIPELNAKRVEFKSILSKTMKRELYPLQELSAFHMAFSKNACNFSVPGAGKTSIVYGAYSYLKSLPREHPNHVDRLVIIGPLASFYPWEDEYEKCFGFPVNSFRASGKNKKQKNITRQDRLDYFYNDTPCELTLISYGAIDNYKDQILFFLKENKCMLVVDEAHRIKNPDGAWGKSVVDISREAISRVVLTGTPAPNGYEDIYNLIKFIYPFSYSDILKAKYRHLKELSTIEDPCNQDVIDFKERLSPFFIRIKKGDLGLPGTTHKVIRVSMSNEQRMIYDFLLDSYLQGFKVNNAATIKDTLNKAKLIRLRQAASNPAMLLKPIEDSLESNSFHGEYDEDPNHIYSENNSNVENNIDIYELVKSFSNGIMPQKYIAAKEVVEKKIRLNEKIIIWTIFVHNAKELKSYLERFNIKVRLLIGEIDIDEREDTIKRFNNPENFDFCVVIANPFSVSESISLHKGCRNALYLERDYNCANFLQSRDRIHRYGQELEANYYYLISSDSIDEIIDDRLQLKIRRLEELINDDIPLFSTIDDLDETEIVKELIKNEI